MSFTAYLAHVGANASRMDFSTTKGVNNTSSILKKPQFSDESDEVCYADNVEVSKEWSVVLEAFSDIVAAEMFAVSVIACLFQTVMRNLAREMDLTKKDFQTSVAKLKYAVSDKKNVVMYRDEQKVLRIQRIDLFVGQTSDDELEALPVLPRETVSTTRPAPSKN